ncbi:MAG: protein translocase subunit SecF [Ilumatobacter sp.]|jgi:preprotein translocase subunit SecF|uniref:protein translocase subunit SecF n=1 Tax=Ilumatobacter sp. TaxID=1967498 RepID=UPI001D876C91|nr:protein translocase subunit SecF [Ilumatobacter sp.]MBT5275090.1 protein translocase subunit SecF [Ilumatobacter sp.]MBT5553046.1 protein translocase subunit SecF [Ilumatobacter sp.]MBT5864114.1 protein translocase subunit SecF [Ilumatobacter sp.]MDG0976421.1 protein translocase subunit SecF [Ilumatobacter sp.]
MSRGDHIASTGLGRLFRGQTAVDFYGKRRIGLIVAIVVIVVTLLSLFTRGLNLGLDFEGGDAWDVPASETFTTDDAADVLEENGVSTTGARIQRRSGETTDVVTIQIEEVSRDVALDLTNGFAERAGVDAEEISFSFTSSTWGGEITEKAVRALVIFLIIVSIFISIRFEYRMAVAALAAMVHDVIVVVGVYSVFGFEVTPATVIAFLTILGYSLYDTIVVFDRVQENEGKYAGVRMPYEDIVNISMNQVLMRSINTSISSILPVISLLLIGSGLLGAVTLREFALALLVGMISGIYSSIFVATPLLAGLKANVGRKARRERLTGDNLRAAVIGSGVTGRVAAAPTAAGGDNDDGGDEHDDDAKTAAILEPAGKLLTHPPRPRKKKRR